MHHSVILQRMTKGEILKNLIIPVALVVVGLAASPYALAQQQVACPLFGPKTVAGAAIGGALGAGIGAAVTKGKGPGTLFGGLAGSSAGAAIGAQLDKADCMRAQQALQQITNQKTGQPIPWSNTDSGDHGSITPVSDASKDANGQVCRKYHTDSVAKDGTTQAHDGVTCEQANGDWVAQS